MYKKLCVSYELEISGAFLSENVLTFPQMQYSGVIWYRKIEIALIHKQYNNYVQKQI